MLTLEPLSEADVGALLRRALADAERGLARLQSRGLGRGLARARARLRRRRPRRPHRARSRLSRLREPDTKGVRRVGDEQVVEALGRARFAYDKGGEEHYNLASALIKSLRNSRRERRALLARAIDRGRRGPDLHRAAALHPRLRGRWARRPAGHRAGGGRRADHAAHRAARRRSTPCRRRPSTWRARRSRTQSSAPIYAAAADAADTAREPVPLHLRNAVTPLMKALGYGKGYRYVHDDPNAREEMHACPKPCAGGSIGKKAKRRMMSDGVQSSKLQVQS